jgi:hypothetical protein
MPSHLFGLKDPLASGPVPSVPADGVILATRLDDALDTSDVLSNDMGTSARNSA